MIEIPPWPLEILQGTTWRVRIDGRDVPTIRTKRGEVLSCTVTGPCTVEAYAPAPCSTAAVRPRRLGIEPHVTGQRIAFQLPGPGHALIEADGSPLLHFFADPPPEEMPSGARLFQAGTLHREDVIQVTEGQCLWVERGAVLNAHLRAEGAGIRIGGGGVITGDGLPGHRHIVCDGCPGIVLRDLTLIDPGGWCVILGASDGARCDNLRIVTPGSGAGTDGIDVVGSSHVRIDGCYAICGDDALVIKAFPADHIGTKRSWARPVRDVIATRCMVGTAGGHGMEIGHELTVDAIEDIAFRDIDVLFAHQFGSPFGIHAGDRAAVRRISYERVTIDHCYHQIMDLRVMRSRYNHDEQRGSISDVTFTDIDWNSTIYNAGYTVGLIGGYDAQHGVRGVRFTRFRRDGKIIRSADDIDLLFRHADGIVFADV